MKEPCFLSDNSIFKIYLMEKIGGWRDNVMANPKNGNWIFSVFPRDGNYYVFYIGSNFLT